MTKPLQVAVAFPKYEADRARLRKLVPEAALPALYSGGEDRLCAGGCGMVLNVGPRVVAMGVAAYCPECLFRDFADEVAAERFDLLSLDNPESKPE